MKTILATAGLCTMLAASTASATETLPSTLEGDAAQATYCFYVRSIALQTLAASGGNVTQAMQELKTVQTWQAVTNRLLPDRTARNQQMANTLVIFNQQIEGIGGDPVAARAQIAAEVAPACERLMARSDLQAAETPAPNPEPEATAPAAAPAPAPTPPFKARPAASPFAKEVFAPGWRGDLVWDGQSASQRATLTSLDHVPPGNGQPHINFNLRVAGRNARDLCVGHLIETGTSPDGLTLHAQPVAGNTCGQARRVRVTALTAERIRVEVEEAGHVVASGFFQPVNYTAQLPATAALDPGKAVPAPVQATASATPPPPVGAASATKTQPAAAASASASASTATETASKTIKPNALSDCATCLPSDSAPGAAANDLFSGLFATSPSGRFWWDWHDTDLFNEKTQGTLTRTSAAGAPLAFRLDFESRIRVLCVGELRETGRSVGGYVVHLTVKPGTGTGCQPQVTHGYLNPYVSGNETSRASLLSLRLYDAQDRLIANSLLRSHALETKDLVPELAERAKATLQEMEERAETVRKDARIAALQTNPEYPRLAPFYNACLQAAPGIFGVGQPQPYCLCMTYKFGLGERIPQAEFASYAQDFSRLVAQFSGAHTEENKLYTRLDGTCKHCSHPGAELNTYCAERDSLLYKPSNYADVIRLLDTAEPQVDATDFYKKVFFRTYLQGFSIFCRDDVVDPVRFDYIVKEFRIGNPWADPNGEVTQHTETFVAQRYAARYRRFRDELNQTDPSAIGQAMQGAAVTSAGQLRQKVDDARRLLEIEMENRMAIRRHLENACGSASVRRVYSNLDALVR